MILLPVGFGRKLPSFPLMTAAIVVLTTVISIPFFKTLGKLEATKTAAEKNFEYKEKVLALAAEHCVPQSLSEAECALVRRLVELRFSREPGADQLMKKAVEESLKGLNVKEMIASAERSTASLKALLSDPAKMADGVKALPSHAALAEAYREVSNRVVAEQRSSGLLTPKMFGLPRLLLAEVTHAGWMHLIGNLLVFIAFAGMVEARIGAVAFLGLYVLGGTVGMLAQLLTMKDSGHILLGASANVSAVTGAFFVFFLKRQMRVLCSLVIYNKIVEFPTWIIVPVLFVMSDVTGLLGAGGGVAHLAHIAGFAFGGAFAWIMKSQDKMSDSYLYPAEIGWHLEMRQTPGLEAKLEVAEKILKVNPDNYEVQEESFSGITQCFGSAADARLPNGAHQFLTKNLVPVVALAIRRRNVVRVEKILESFPLHLSFLTYLRGLGQQSLIDLGERQLKRGNWLMAMRLYDLYRFTYPKAAGGPALEQTMSNVLAHLLENGADLSSLAEYRLREPRTTFSNLLAKFETHNIGVRSA